MCSHVWKCEMCWVSKHQPVNPEEHFKILGHDYRCWKCIRCKYPLTSCTFRQNKKTNVSATTDGTLGLCCCQLKDRLSNRTILLTTHYRPSAVNRRGEDEHWAGQRGSALGMSVKGCVRSGLCHVKCKQAALGLSAGGTWLQASSSCGSEIEQNKQNKAFNSWNYALCHNIIKDMRNCQGCTVLGG